MSVINLTKGGFENRIAKIDKLAEGWHFIGERPALIDFYASWCGPCQRLMPTIEEVAAELDGKVDIYKVNVDDEQELADLFKIRSVPTLLFIPMDGEPLRAMGALPKAQLKAAIKEHLGIE
jgi:thioredoxin